MLNTNTTLTEKIDEIAVLSEWVHPTTGEVRLYVNEAAPFELRGTLSFLLGGVQAKSVSKGRVFDAVKWVEGEWVRVSNSSGTNARVENKVYFSTSTQTWVGVTDADVIDALNALLPEEAPSEEEAAELLVAQEKPKAEEAFQHAISFLPASEAQEELKRLLRFMQPEEILSKKWSRNARRKVSVEKVQEALDLVLSSVEKK